MAGERAMIRLFLRTEFHRGMRRRNEKTNGRPSPRSPATFEEIHESSELPLQCTITRTRRNLNTREIRVSRNKYHRNKSFNDRPTRTSSDPVKTKTIRSSRVAILPPPRRHFAAGRPSCRGPWQMADRRFAAEISLVASQDPRPAFALSARGI